MISRKNRQARILEIIELQEVGSQARLAELLRKAGSTVTQPTLSRDIRDLGLVKVRGRYRQADGLRSAPAEDNLRRSLKQLVIDSKISGNILMVKTSPGNAQTLGVVIDAARWPEILGTVAGDDTVFALLKSPRSGPMVKRRIEGLMA
jgi:transcriptional regulator of arginine metabolism